MIQDLSSETPLTIEYHGCARQAFDEKPDECAFMQMCVYHVWFEAFRDLRGRKEEQCIQIQLVPRRSRALLLIPGYRWNSKCWDVGHISPKMIGADRNLMPVSDQCSCLLEDAHMTTTIREIGRGRYLQDLQ